MKVFLLSRRLHFRNTQIDKDVSGNETELKIDIHTYVYMHEWVYTSS